jgi:hypothetical protein
MAGRPRKIRCIQSYINNIDNNTASGPMKMGTGPSIGVTRNYWYNYITQCNSAQTPVSAGFRPTTNYNYSYNAPPGVAFYDPNSKFNNHYYRPYFPPVPVTAGKFQPASKHMTGFVSK